MELRQSLLPPVLDDTLVSRLADLAATLDGSPESACDDMLAQFSQLSGCKIPYSHFQGISGGEEHETWVRRVLISEYAVPTENVTRDELVEIARRAMPQNGFVDHEAYMEILDCNLPETSNLIFYPADYDSSTNTWGDGKMMGEYDPTPEQIIDWKLNANSAE